MSHFVKCLLNSVLSLYVTSSPPLFASHFEGSKTHGKEVKMCKLRNEQRGNDVIAESYSFLCASQYFKMYVCMHNNVLFCFQSPF